MDCILANQRNFVAILTEIIEFLTCPVCKKLLQKPLAPRDCQHRVCETCISHCKHNNQDLECLVCRAKFSKTDIQPQNHLEEYIENLKTLIEKLNQEKQLRKSVSGLYEFCFQPKQSTKFETKRVEKDHENINPNVMEEADQSNLIETFDPKICSTTIKKRKPTKLVSLENSLMSTNENSQKLKFLTDDTIIEEGSENQDESSVQKKSILTTDIEMIPDSQFVQPEIPIFCNNRSQFEDQHSEEESATNFDKSALANPAEETQQSSYQTQSQYHVLKSTITYTHKKLDKFDAVINSTKPEYQNDSNINSNNKDYQDDDEEAFLMKIMDTTVSTGRSNGSASPEMFLFDSDTDDEELRTSVLKF